MPRDFKDPVALKLFKKPGVAKDGSPEILLDYVSSATPYVLQGIPEGHDS